MISCSRGVTRAVWVKLSLPGKGSPPTCWPLVTSLLRRWKCCRSVAPGIHRQDGNGANSSTVGLGGLIQTVELPMWGGNLVGLVARPFPSMRVSRDLETGMQREFFEDVVHVTLNRVGRNMKSTRDV